MRDNTGPIYGVKLLEALPLGKSGMNQAMASREDLKRVKQVSERTAAAYEVLTEHYREVHRENLRFRLLIEDVIKGQYSLTRLQEAIGAI